MKRLCDMYTNNPMCAKAYIKFMSRNEC